MSVGDTAPERTFFATCPRGVSELLASELRALGLEVEREHPAGVGFRGTLRSAYLACLWSRTASRILLTLGEVTAADPDAMYQALRAMPWEVHVRPEGTFAIDIVGESPAWLRNTQFAALKAKDAIVDRMRELNEVRPSVDRDAPDVRIGLRFARDRVTVGIDLSGAPLHRRGYRQAGVEAPLKENLAAALLLRCGWPAFAREGAAFFDPMCGSGTLVIEAALIAANIAPGLLRRRFGFERWLQHDAALWTGLRAETESARRLDELRPGLCAGSDRDQPAIRAAIANANLAGLGNHLVFDRREVAQLTPSRHAHGLVLVNPPYGVRLGGRARARGRLRRPSDGSCSRAFPAGTRALIVGDPGLGRALGLRAYRSHTFFNGAIECRLLRFRLDETAVEPDRATVRAARLEAARVRPGVDDVRQPAAQERRAASRTGRDATRSPAIASTMPTCPSTRSPSTSTATRALGLRAGIRGAATVAEESARARPRRGAGGDPGGARRTGGAHRPARTPPPARRRAVREARQRSRSFTSCARAATASSSISPTISTPACSSTTASRGERIGELAAGTALPEPVRLHRHRHRARRRRRGGASTTVDMSRTYLDWARRNLALNGLAGRAHEFVQADCLAWLDEQAHGSPAALRPHLRRSADALAVEAHGAGVRRAARPRVAARDGRPAARARRHDALLEQLPALPPRRRRRWRRSRSRT